MAGNQQAAPHTTPVQHSSLTSPCVFLRVPSGNTSYGHQHRPQLQADHEPRDGSWQQSGSGCHHGPGWQRRPLTHSSSFLVAFAPSVLPLSTAHELFRFSFSPFFFTKYLLVIMMPARHLVGLWVFFTRQGRSASGELVDVCR